MEESLEIVVDLLTTYYEERDYLYYISMLPFRDNPPSYNEFINKFKKSSSKVARLTKEEKEKIMKENNNTLKLFLNKENYKEVSINDAGSI